MTTVYRLALSHFSGERRSPTRTVPPTRIFAFSPERLIKGLKTGFPVTSSRCLQGTLKRVASRRASPNQKRRPTRCVRGTPKVVTLRRCSAGKRSIPWSRRSASGGSGTLSTPQRPYVTKPGFRDGGVHAHAHTHTHTAGAKGPAPGEQAPARQRRNEEKKREPQDGPL